MSLRRPSRIQQRLALFVISLLLVACARGQAPVSDPIATGVAAVATVQVGVTGTINTTAPRATTVPRASSAPASSVVATPASPSAARTAGAATPAPSPTPVLFLITGTNGEGVRLRSNPGGPAIKVYPEGARLEQIGPDRDLQGTLWRNVRAADGAVGWVAAQYTSVAPPGTRPMGPAADNTNGPLKKYRLVTYYGHPFSDRMGILGEYPPEVMMAKLKEQTAAYTAADPSRPALCTVELIASVAQGTPGKDGLYLLRTPTDVIEQYAQLAQSNGCLLLLDIQGGYDTVTNEINALLPFLQRPYVQLAIDPEFRMKPGQVPGEEVGTLRAAEIAEAGKLLAGVVTRFNIPDKVLVIHQFRASMLPDKALIQPMDRVELVLVMDGWGAPAAKVGNYGAFVRDELIQYGGIKIFYRQDDPLLTPEEVIKLDPSPVIIIYQ